MKEPSVYQYKLFFGSDESHIGTFYIKGRGKMKEGVMWFQPLVLQSADMIISGTILLENVHEYLRKNETYLYVIFRDNRIGEYNVITGEQLWNSKIEHIRTMGTDFTYEVYEWNGRDFEKYVPAVFWEDSMVMFFDKDTGEHMKTCLVETKKLNWLE